MENNTININHIVKDGNDEIKDVAYMHCHIGNNLNAFKIIVHIEDKELYKENIELLQSRFKDFLTESLEKAVEYGWDMCDINKSK